MQPARGVADQFAEPVLDMHVNVFQRRIFMQLARFNLSRNLQEPLIDCLAISSGNYALLGKHRRMSAAGGDILTP